MRGISVQEDNQISNRGEDKMIVEEVTEELPGEQMPERFRLKDRRKQLIV